MKAVYFFITTLLFSQNFIAGRASAGGVVCLYDSTDIEIKRNFSAVVKIYKDFEIISEEGLAYAEFAVPINDYIEFSDLKGYTELPDSKKIKIGEKDYIFLTGRMDREFGGKKAVLVLLKSPSIGAILHYRYRLDIKSLLYLPHIERQNSYPVERMVVQLKWPRNINLNYDYSGFDKDVKGRRALFYADNLPEIRAEPFLCHDNLYLYLSADRFRFNGPEYGCDTWDDVGFFYSRISDQPTPSLVKIKVLADKLLAESVSLIDSLKILFDYVADSVSYVALRIGSGDFMPHNCGQIIERGFGDCKDQSLLLSSLFRAADIEAYPALISTVDYPRLESLHPWPAFFDHTVTAVRIGEEEYILDPSDPFSDFSYIPFRLRGKSYLVVDGISELRTVREGSQPAEGFSWSFDMGGELSGMRTDFVIGYINDAAAIYSRNFRGLSSFQKSETVEAILREGGWKTSALEIEIEKLVPDTFSIGGEFFSDYSELDSMTGFPVGSPLVTHLIDNIFNTVRQSPFCRKNSLRLEEYIRFRDMAFSSDDLSEYRDYWVREGLEFYDEMKYIGNDIIFRRIFDLDGREISSDDFNAFRNFLLSRKNQRYVYLPY
ncbi:MAG: DUF3857 domain-containing protein [Candidatus Zixiibacteriota bacterium]|nr:MAG: DUF3857 domain-containing protein [candidate division Zixibacteria bacterium]